MGKDKGNESHHRKRAEYKLSDMQGNAKSGKLYLADTTKGSEIMIWITWKPDSHQKDWLNEIFTSDKKFVDWFIINQSKIMVIAVERYDNASAG